MTQFFPRNLLLVILAFSVQACETNGPAGQDFAFESSLSMSRAMRIWRNSTIEPQRAYALRQIKRHAGNDNRTALRVLGQAYQQGDGVEADPMLAAQYFEDLYRVDGRENNNVAYTLFGYYTDPDLPTYDPERGLALAEGLAEQGDATAHNLLLQVYQDGPLASSSDTFRIVSSIAAKRGSDNDRMRLARFYLKMEEPFYDPLAALDIHMALAEEGNASAISQLGVTYMVGRGVVQDQERAVAYFRDALERGNVLAGHELGVAYLTGRGVKRDVDRASELFRTSMAANYRPSWIVTSQFLKPVYIEALQRELTNRSVYNGPINGQPSQALTDALSLHCVERGVSAACDGSPFDRDTVIALARSFQE